MSTDLFLFIIIILFSLSSGQRRWSYLEERPWFPEFRRFVSLPCTAVCVDLCPLVGHEGGVMSEQTYDRVEAIQVRDSDTRAARCEYCRASLVTCLTIVLVLHVCGRRMHRMANISDPPPFTVNNTSPTPPPTYYISSLTSDHTSPLPLPIFPCSIVHIPSQNSSLLHANT